MAVLFDTTTLEPEERAERWAHACETIFFPMAVHASGGDLSSSRIERHLLGPIKFYKLASDHGLAQRTEVGIRVHDPETLLVATGLRGSCVIEQDGRQSAFSPGDLSSWDSSRPFRAAHVEPFELLFLTMPRALLGARADLIYRHTAGCVPRNSPLGSVTGLFLEHIWQALDSDMPPANHVDLTDAVIAMVRAVHSSDAGSPNSTHQLSGPTLLAKVKAYIDENLGDPGLALEAVARAHFVSTRYLQKLFAAEGMPLSDWIRHRRLEACRRDLVDPARADETISAICRRWALSNPAHFSRIFRHSYGCTPSEYREGRGPLAA